MSGFSTTPRTVSLSLVVVAVFATSAAVFNSDDPAAAPSGSYMIMVGHSTGSGEPEVTFVFDTRTAETFNIVHGRYEREVPPHTPSTTRPGRYHASVDGLRLRMVDTATGESYQALDQGIGRGRAWVAWVGAF